MDPFAPTPDPNQLIRVTAAFGQSGESRPELLRELTDLINTAARPAADEEPPPAVKWESPDQLADASRLEHNLAEHVADREAKSEQLIRQRAEQAAKPSAANDLQQAEAAAREKAAAVLAAIMSRWQALAARVEAEVPAVAGER
jgi:hypothetical protein